MSIMDKSLLDYSLGDFIEKAKDKTSVPGGGSICALNASLAASLAIMVYRLSSENIPKDRIEERLRMIEDILPGLRANIDGDSMAFDRALRAFSLPKDTEEERAYRSREIQEGYREAIEVPLATMRGSLALARILEDLAQEASLHALTDVAIGGDLLNSAIKGAGITIELNLKSLKDQKARDGYGEESRTIQKESEEIVKKIRLLVEKRVFCG